ncbi:MAG: hypothetical protein KDA89_04860 [Planctomycetaceae bacterium]|nr:hypothetical protein [Planctomycetaceae bacterium]
MLHRGCPNGVIAVCQLTLPFVLLTTCNVIAVAGDPPEIQVVSGIEFVTEGNRPYAELNHLAAEFLAVSRKMAADLELSIPSQTVRIFLFRDRRKFAKFVTEHIPSVRTVDVAVRHGIFLLRQGHPYIFLLESKDIVRTVRHEAAHVVLNLNSPDVPIWVDEGLAQCYESPSGDYDSPQARKILKWDWLRRDEPEIAELVGMTNMQQLTPRDYAGCWELAYHLLTNEQNGKPLLRSYMAALREKREPPRITQEWIRVASTPR